MRLKRAISMGVAVVAILAGGFVAVGRYKKQSEQSLKHRLERDVLVAKAAGVPLVASDVAIPISLPKDENAATFLLDPRIEKELIEKPSVHDAYMAIVAGDVDSARADLKRKSSLLIRIRKQALLRCYFYHDLDAGFMVLYPELARSKSCIRALCIEAELEAADGQAAACFLDLRFARNIAADAGMEPNVLSYVVQAADERLILDSSLRTLARRATDSAFLTECKSFLSEPWPKSNIARALRGEAYERIATARNLTAINSDLEWENSGGKRGREVDPRKLRRSGIPADPSEMSAMANELEAWTPICATVKDSDPQSASFESVLKTGIERTGRTQWGLAQELLGWGDPDFHAAWDAQKTVLALRRSADALVACLLYAQRVRHYPTNLAEAGVTDSDPFTGGPLHMITRGHQILVYSVGRDRVDNGGVPKTTSDQVQYDIVAAFPPLPKHASGR